MFNCLSPLSRTHFTWLEIDVSFSSPQLHALNRVPLNKYLVTVKNVHCSDTLIPGNRYPGMDSLEFLLDIMVVFPHTWASHLIRAREEKN